MLPEHTVSIEDSDNWLAVLQGTGNNTTKNNSSHLSIMMGCCSIALVAGRQFPKPKAIDQFHY